MKHLIAVLVIMLTTLPAWATTCPSWDVKAYCCPSACAAKKLPGFKADQVLRQCMRGLGCDQSEGATTFQWCSCQ
jgi:hypothetical protein